MDTTAQKIITFIKNNGQASSKTIHEQSGVLVSYATTKRALTKLCHNQLIVTHGKGKGTVYSISPVFALMEPVNLEKYFEKEIDERVIKSQFHFKLITDLLPHVSLFTVQELSRLNALQQKFQTNFSQLSPTQYQKEFERLAIDLSWKSSQIEGNTYSLLETERLLKEKETAAGKTKEEAIMLLNHKSALDFLLANPDYLHPLSVSKIEDIHSVLIKDLVVERNIRKTRVGISGTNYRPIDNRYQITEALTSTCEVINNKKNVFEKALLALTLISYIQPFIDGNKRTARIVSNAILMHHGYCPLSFRTVDSIAYKKAMLLFYEQNNITAMKDIFINQYEFAVGTYF